MLYQLSEHNNIYTLSSQDIQTTTHFVLSVLNNTPSCDLMHNENLIMHLFCLFLFIDIQINILSQSAQGPPGQHVLGAHFRILRHLEQSVADLVQAVHAGRAGQKEDVEPHAHPGDVVDGEHEEEPYDRPQYTVTAS